jgi:hypothetical protein
LSCTAKYRHDILGRSKPKYREKEDSNHKVGRSLKDKKRKNNSNLGKYTDNKASDIDETFKK